MNKEIWKDIKDYEGLYQVSNLGRVKSLARKSKHSRGYIAYYKEKILAPASIKGYLVVNLSKDGSNKRYYIHRLVASAFIPNPDNLPEVNHIDENKMNNSVENLEWCNHSYNSNHGTRAERISKANTNNIKISKSVLCVETGIIYASVHEAGRQMNLDFSQIATVCRGYRNRKTYAGYHWKYV